MQTSAHYIRATAANFSGKQQLQEIVLRQLGPKSTFLYAPFVTVTLYDLKGELSDSRHILGGIAFSCPAHIFFEGNIRIPVQLILNRPVSASQHIEIDSFRKVLITDITADGFGRMVSVFHRQCDFDQSFQTGPST